MQGSLLLILALMSFSGLCFANEPLPKHASGLASELAETEFATILGKYQQFSRMDVHFSQIKTLTDLGLKLPSEGQLTIIRPDTVIWQINKPDTLKMVINSKEISMQSGKEAAQKWPLDQVPEKMAGSPTRM